MFNRLFGQYLWKKGILSSTQLQEALQLEQSTHVKIGVLAVNSGYMKAEQIEEVHQLQARQDKRFGEIAIEKGYITAEKLEELLGQQRKSHLLLSQAILDRGYMSLEEIAKALEEYKQESGLTEEDINSDDPEKIIKRFITLTTNQDDEIYYDYYTLLIKNILRFLDSQPVLDSQIPSLNNPWYIVQKIIGPRELITVLAMEEPTLIRMAALFSNEPLDTFDELAQASVTEFLNQHNGLFIVNMSNQGMELSLEPQFISQTIPEGLDTANLAILELPFGKMKAWIK